MSLYVSPVEGSPRRWMRPSVTVTSPGLRPCSGDRSSSATTSRKASNRWPAASWITPRSDAASPEPPDCGAGGRSRRECGQDRVRRGAQPGPEAATQVRHEHAYAGLRHAENGGEVLADHHRPL